MVEQAFSGACDSAVSGKSLERCAEGGEGGGIGPEARFFGMTKLKTQLGHTDTKPKNRLRTKQSTRCNGTKAMVRVSNGTK